jgi:membrane protease YdiL (CAAX protease family)
VADASLKGRLGLALVELAVVVALFAADAAGAVPLSKVPFLFALGWISLRARGLAWADVGFARPPSWGAALAAGVLAGAGMSLLELFVSQPLLVAALGHPPDLSGIPDLRGNLALLLLLLALLWILAAFGEELVYRGWLMSRIAGLAGGGWPAWWLSLVVVSAAFGMGHLDQGITGQIENVINGLLLGLVYLASGRNLVAPIVAHGVQDTVDLILLYLGAYPVP